MLGTAPSSTKALDIAVLLSSLSNGPQRQTRMTKQQKLIVQIAMRRRTVQVGSPTWK